MVLGASWIALIYICLGFRLFQLARLGRLVLPSGPDGVSFILWPGSADFPCQVVLVFAITVFEIGSLVCGVAQNVGQLIAGRTVSGIGAAGIFISILQVMAHVTRLEDRARLYGTFGAVFGISERVIRDWATHWRRVNRPCKILLVL
ncbi:hypothetical protein B0H10DRAFT_691503 [Mycena sp. CBHHK59/15]|nr:hypothetical protein B0H10DRAFT_691503 [Mycena sp. CBHHK59/15]